MIQAFIIVPLIFIAFALFIFWVIMLVDVATRKFKESNDKLVWILVVVLVGLIGGLVYYFVIYSKDKSKSINWFWITLLLLVILLAITFSFV